MLASETPSVPPTPITKGSELAAALVDRLRVRVVKAGKTKGGQIPITHLNTMLQSEVFLQQFRPVDQVTTTPLYLPDFTLTTPGYNDGGPGNRILYCGTQSPIERDPATILRFLDAMPFATTADCTNALAAALTVTFHNHFLGGKPLTAVRL